MAEGCTVATATFAKRVGRAWPRWRVTRKSSPKGPWLPSRPQTDAHLGLDQFDLFLQPRQARRDFAGAGRFVQTAFSLGYPLEVFDDVGDIGVVAVDAGGFEAFVQQTAGRTDERLAPVSLPRCQAVPRPATPARCAGLVRRPPAWHSDRGDTPDISARPRGARSAKSSAGKNGRALISAVSRFFAMDLL